MPFFRDFIKRPITYIPGGCSFNALRVFNWLYNNIDGKKSPENLEEKVGFLGSVAKDEFGDKYISLLANEGIVPIFQAYDEKRTGLCMVVCNQKERTHFTDLGISTEIDEKFIDKYWDKIKDCEMIYTELFIIKHQYEFLKRLAELGSQKNKVFGFNLPSFYFLKKFKNQIMTIYNDSDIVFSNMAEARYFANLLELGDDLSEEELIVKLASLHKNKPNKSRIFVITNGPLPALACEYNFIEQKAVAFVKIPPTPVDPQKVIDTNGAGDSFAGGFLAQLMKGKSLEECMVCGHWAASYIIQTRGCQIPFGVDYDPVAAKNEIYNQDINYINY